jgi:hypothetical protein
MSPRYVVPCQNDMVRPQIADGGDDLQIWRIAASILNKQSRTADKGWFPDWGLGEGLTSPPLKITSCYEMSKGASDLDRDFWMTWTMENGNEIWNMEC